MISNYSFNQTDSCKKKIVKIQFLNEHFTFELSKMLINWHNLKNQVKQLFLFSVCTRIELHQYQMNQKSIEIYAEHAIKLVK